MDAKCNNRRLSLRSIARARQGSRLIVSPLEEGEFQARARALKEAAAGLGIELGAVYHRPIKTGVILVLKSSEEGSMQKNTDSGARGAIYPLSEEGLRQSGLPPFVQEKVRRIATVYRIEGLRVEEHAGLGERVTLWSETAPELWFYQGGAAAWANTRGAYTTFDRIAGDLLPPSPSPDEVWWLRLAGEEEPYTLEATHLTLRWGEVKGGR